MKVTMRSIARYVVGATLISAFVTAVYAQALEKSIEDVGVITSVSPATSMFSVGDRNLRVTTATRVTAEDVELRNSRMSEEWVGRQVAMETHEEQDGALTVDRLHFFSAPQ